MTHMLQMKKWKTIRIKIIHINEKNHFYTFYTFFQLPRNKKPVFSKKIIQDLNLFLKINVIILKTHKHHGYEDKTPYNCS